MSETASSLKNGNKVLIENQPYIIINTEFVNPGKGQAFTRIKVKNLLNNKVLEKTVKIGESLSEADVVNTDMQFLYAENKKLFFMNLETYEQLEVNNEILEERAIWLCEGDECEVIMWNGKIIQVQLPQFVTLKVKSTETASKGDTVSASQKEAILENGAEVKVPAFIKEGESIKVDTKSGEYSSRIKNL